MMKERTIKTTADILQCIEERRKELKKSISAIEEKCSIGSGTMSRWKSNAAKPTLNTILAIFDFLDIEVILRTKKRKKCPRFFNQSNAILDSKSLEKNIKDALKTQVSGEAAEIAVDILFSERVPITDKEKICQMLNYFLTVEEIRSFNAEDT